MSPYFCYRDAQNQQELEALLRLRYEVYRSSRLKGFCPENPWGLDMDCYDCRARHFGLFNCENGKERPVGYMRVIQQEETATAGWVRRIACRNSMELLAKVCAEPKNPFPAMDYVPGAKAELGKLLREIEWGQCCEASRFIILPEVSSLRLGKNIIESAIAIYFYCYGFKSAVVVCSELHSHLYSEYGFKVSSDSAPFILEKSNDKYCSQLMTLSLPDYNENTCPELRQNIALFAYAYRRHKCICFGSTAHDGVVLPDEPDFFLKYAFQKNLTSVRVNSNINL